MQLRLWFFQWSCMDVRVGLWRKLSAKELMFLNCGVGEDSWGPLDCKEIQPVHPKGAQSWVFIGRTDVEAEIPILRPLHVKSWLIWKDPDAGKDWGQEENWTTKDKMVGWHHQLYRHGFGWALGVGDGQGGLECWGSWGHKEPDTTEQLHWYIYNQNNFENPFYHSEDKGLPHVLPTWLPYPSYGSYIFMYMNPSAKIGSLWARE